MLANTLKLSYIQKLHRSHHSDNDLKLLFSASNFMAATFPLPPRTNKTFSFWPDTGGLIWWRERVRWCRNLWNTRVPWRHQRSMTKVCAPWSWVASTWWNPAGRADHAWPTSAALIFGKACPVWTRPSHAGRTWPALQNHTVLQTEKDFRRLALAFCVA